MAETLLDICVRQEKLDLVLESTLGKIAEEMAETYFAEAK
jgi:hypothetical protein